MTVVFDPAHPLDTAFTNAIAVALRTFLDEASTRLVAIDPSLALTANLARTFTAGGKRLRPAFCYWARVAASGQPDDPAPLLRACASLDLLHVSALIHDDVMDDSDARRGVPAAHRQFESAHRKLGGRGNSAAYGRAAAIQLGNLLAAWSVELAESSGLPAVDLANGRQVLNAVRTEVAAGQLLDLTAQSGLAPTADAIAFAEKVVKFKTARYTIQRPAQWGASLGHGSAELIAAVKRFGDPLGRAFQYRDDLLGVFGHEDVTGKPSGDDLREGKRTVLIAEAANASPTVAAELENLLGVDLSPAALTRARQLLIDSGAVKKVENLIESDYASSLKILDETPMTQDGRTALRVLARLSVERSA